MARQASSCYNRSMSRTRIKICGITSPEDAVLAAELGADAIGLNFFAGPRKIDAACGARILAKLPPLITAVALTRGDESAAADCPSVAELLTHEAWGIGAHTFQLYGREHPMGFFGRTPGHFSWWCVVAIARRNDIADAAEFMDLYELKMPTAVVFDTASPTKLGGSGQSFNWNWIAEARAAGELKELPPIILGGGLTPDNVAEAIRIARPYAVDVSSGVEFPGQPGKKDPARLRDFIQAVRSADNETGST